MSLSRDFEGGVTLMDDGTTVRVDGTSKDNGLPTSDDPATQIIVVIEGLSGAGGLLVSRVEGFPVGANWPTFFPDAVSALDLSKPLRVHGIALCPQEEPFTWNEEHTLVTRGGIGVEPPPDPPSP